jgi:hypothetical protein
MLGQSVVEGIGHYGRAPGNAPRSDIVRTDVELTGIRIIFLLGAAIFA